MARWVKGQSGNPSGRRRGSLNKATVDVRELSKRLLLDADYLERTRKRLLAGTIAPGLEVALWAYAFGRPLERMEISHAELPALQVIVVDDYSEPASEEEGSPQ